MTFKGRNLSMISKREQIAITVLTVIALPTGICVGQTTDNIILQRTNLELAANQSYATAIILQPYSTYSIVSDIDPINESIIDALVRIRISSDTNSRTMLHRGDTRHRNSTFIPFSAYYIVNVTNMGYISIISINLTIIRIGGPINNPISPDIALLMIILPLSLITGVPLLVLYLSLVLYRRQKKRMP
jgi:hypothetical protein